MKKVFLESHNIKNLNFGFGQFNYHLISALQKINTSEYRITLNGKDTSWLRNEFGDAFDYHKSYSLHRYPFFRIKKKYDLWHCLNQNIKIEPHHKLPYLLTVHNITYIKDITNYKEETVHKNFQEKLNRSDAITYISEYAKKSTHEFFDVPKVAEHVIHNGNPLTDTSVPDSFTPDFVPSKPFLFSIGQITERKNFNSLVKMLPHLNDYQLIIAGKNTTSTSQIIKETIEQLNLSESVHLVGTISEVSKKWYYKNCSAFVFPSLREGFGLPIIEAMLFGKPVFTSNNTSLPEIGGSLAYYWEHYEAKYMAEIFKDGMNHFLKNETKNKEDAIARAKSFNWGDAAVAYHNVYKSLL